MTRQTQEHLRASTGKLDSEVIHRYAVYYAEITVPSTHTSVAMQWGMKCVIPPPATHTAHLLDLLLHALKIVCDDIVL